MNFRVLLVLLFITSLSISASAAETEPTISQLDQARAYIAAGRYNDAEEILDFLQEGSVDYNDLYFLRGTLALQRKEFDKAILYFRVVLTRDPSLTRVRLDLARAFFLRGDDAIAEYHFHIAEAAGLPPAVQANVDGILNEIKRRKKWNVDLSFGVQPSTNINTATSTQSVNIFGIPYQLSQSAQKTSGVGLVGAVTGSNQFSMTDNMRLVVGGGVNGTDYLQHSFDDNSVNAFIGPRFLIGQASEATIEATAMERWYGGKEYYTGAGGRVEGKTTLSPRLQLDGAIAAQQLNYAEAYAPYTGPVITISAGATYGIDAVSSMRVDTAVIHEQTDDAAFRDTQYFCGPTYNREFSHGFIGNIGFNVNSAHFDAPSAGFGVTRRDTTLNYQVGGSNRTLNLYGFMPVITYIHTNRYSDVPLYTFSSDRIILGASQNF